VVTIAGILGEVVDPKYLQLKDISDFCFLPGALRSPSSQDRGPYEWARVGLQNINDPKTTVKHRSEKLQSYTFWWESHQLSGDGFTPKV